MQRNNRGRPPGRHAAQKKTYDSEEESHSSAEESDVIFCLLWLIDLF